MKSRRKWYLLLPATGLFVLGAVLLYRWLNPVYSFTVYDRGRFQQVESDSQDPAQVLRQAGVFLTEQDSYTVQTVEEQTQIHVRRAQKVTLYYLGQQQTVYTMGETVGQLLDRLKIDTRAPWQVSVPLDTQTYDGLTLSVDHVEERTETVSRDLPYGTIYCNDPSLPVGTEELLVPGICGRQDTVISATYVNGEQTAVSVMGSTPTEEAVSQIVAIGTGEHVGQPRKYPLFGDNLIVTASGECLYYAYADIYEATAYSAWIDDVSDTTACGTKARVGAVAVDPRVIPYFTKMYIVTQDGAYDYGIASAEDCGGAVKGKIIDLYFDTLAECVQFGRRDIVVYFLTDQPV